MVLTDLALILQYLQAMNGTDNKRGQNMATKFTVKEGTFGAAAYHKGLCPNGDGGSLKRNRCQVCYRLWQLAPDYDAPMRPDREREPFHAD
jgi:hypothetical protein